VCDGQHKFSLLARPGAEQDRVPVRSIPRLARPTTILDCVERAGRAAAPAAPAAWRYSRHNPPCLISAKHFGGHLPLGFTPEIDVGASQVASIRIDISQWQAAMPVYPRLAESGISPARCPLPLPFEEGGTGGGDNAEPPVYRRRLCCLQSKIKTHKGLPF